MSGVNLARYRGHLSLPQVGLAGQRKLAGASVLCVGAGGLGSPAALYLAAAGIGRLGLLDDDAVDETNLHRQILFRSADLGEPKVEAARRTLTALNPEIELVVHPERLGRANAMRLFADYDVVVDGSDNFPTRYAVSDACVQLGKPEVWASVFRFEGQLAVFDARRGPCYRCLFPAMPPDEEIPSCAEAGVLGALPGVLGASQALEAIKLILGIGRPLVGRLMLFDALGLTWSELAIEKDPACPACGEDAETQLAEPGAAEGLEPVALQKRMREDGTLLLVDCREPFEYELCHLPGSRLIPLRELVGRLGELERDRPIVLVCHRGPRSHHAAEALRRSGFADVSYLEGGLNAWARRIDPTMPRY